MQDNTDAEENKIKKGLTPAHAEAVEMQNRNMLTSTEEKEKDCNIAMMPLDKLEENVFSY